MYFYQAVVRPILEYACPAWHTSLTKEQTKSLEDIQRRALQVIIGNIPYEEARCKLNLPQLADRRHSLCKTLFQQITNRESHILHYLGNHVNHGSCKVNMQVRVRYFVNVDIIGRLKAAPDIAKKGQRQVSVNVN